MFREFGKRGWERILLARNRSLFPSRNLKRTRTKGGEIFIQGKVKKDRSRSRSRTNFLRKLSSLEIVAVVYWIGHHPYIRHTSRFFAITRTKDQSNRGCTAIIIISTNIKWTFTRSKELGFNKGLLSVNSISNSTLERSRLVSKINSINSYLTRSTRIKSLFLYEKMYFHTKRVSFVLFLSILHDISYPKI